MPNWCTNHIDITGPADDVWRLVSHSAGEDPETLANLFGPNSTEASRRVLTTAMVQGELGSFTLGGCVPMPAELLTVISPFRGTDEESARLIALYGYNDWYRWAVDKWGTKWELSDVVAKEVADGRVKLVFDTAWAPPERWAETVSEMYPSLTVRVEFFEPGCEAEGWVTFHDGAMIDEGDELEWAQEWWDDLADAQEDDDV